MREGLCVTGNPQFGSSQRLCRTSIQQKIRPGSLLNKQRISKQRLPLPEHKEHGSQNKYKADDVIPFHFLAQVEYGKADEHHQGNYLLNGFELKSGKLPMPDAVGRNLKAVLEKSDQPAYQNHFPERNILEFKVAVPGEGHKDIGDQ